MTPYLAHEGGQPGIGGTVVGAEPELRVVIRCHGKLEIPCREPRRGSPPRRDTGRLVAKTQSWCLVARWGNRDGATPDPVSRLCPGWDQGFASLPSHRGKFFAPEGPCCPGARIWGPSPRAFLSSCGQEGQGRSVCTLLHGGKGHAPSLTILEGMDVAKNPQPVVLPLGRHSQLLHRGAGLPRRRAWITSSVSPRAQRGPHHHPPLLPAGNHLPTPNPASQGLEDQWRARGGRVEPPANPLSRDSRGERAGNGGSSSGAARPRRTSPRRRAGLPSLCTVGEERELSGAPPPPPSPPRLLPAHPPARSRARPAWSG